MISRDYIRWINASINKHFMDRRNNIFLYIEGQNIDLNKKRAWAELRLTGPRIEQVTKNNYLIEIDINIMCTVIKDSDIYEIHKIAGIFQEAMIPIDILKLGLDDDGSLIGCLQLKSDVDVIPWGLVSAGNQRVTNTSVEASYKMEL